MDDELEAIKAYLLSKRVTLWADWDTSRPDRLHLAAAWFQHEMHEFNKFHYETTKQPWGPPTGPRFTSRETWLSPSF